MSSSSDDILIPGEIIKCRWKIRCKIGSGGYGELYEAENIYDCNELVAVKAEPENGGATKLLVEVAVLKQLQGLKHVCTLHDYGRNSELSYLIMTLQGGNLSEYRRNLSKKTLSLSTAIRLGEQILQSIEDLHNRGFVHRDIKPSNFAMGRLKETSNTVYMLDFGMARQYIDKNNQLLPARYNNGFRGTMRYASLNAHNYEDLGRVDDLWSFFYMMVEFISGSLPWRHCTDKDEISRMKEKYDPYRLIDSYPSHFHTFVQHLDTLDFYAKPDYELLKCCFANTKREYSINDDDPFDWVFRSRESSVRNNSVTASTSATDLKNPTLRKSLTNTHMNISNCASKFVNKFEYDSENARTINTDRSANKEIPESFNVSSK